MITKDDLIKITEEVLSQYHDVVAPYGFIFANHFPGVIDGVPMTKARLMKNISLKLHIPESDLIILDNYVKDQRYTAFVDEKHKELVDNLNDAVRKEALDLADKAYKMIELIRSESDTRDKE